ncbi:MAG: HEAT repeat domain-containing protein, partial [Janthinobacterium lividum]
FWEAATCNVNGILELGIEKKLTLLMHLLAQSKINGEFDNRIPHLKQIQNLIDDIVLKDITIWEQPIIDSGYLSEAIVKTVKKKIRNKKSIFQELKAVIEIITSLEWNSKTKIYKGLVNSLKIKDVKLQKIILQKLPQILDDTIDEVVVRESLNTILSLLNIWELNKYVNVMLIQIINIMPSLDRELLNRVQKLKNKSLVATSMIEIVKAIPGLAKKVFNVLKKQVNSSNSSIQFAAIDSIVEIVKIMHVAEAFDILKELLSEIDVDNFADSYVKGEAVKSLGEVVKSMHLESAFKALKELVDDPNKSLNYAAIWSLVEVIKIRPSIAEEVFIILKKLINDSNSYIRDAAARSLGELVKAKPSIAEEIFTILKELISNSDKYIKNAAINSLGKIVKVRSNIQEEVFTILKEVFSNPDSDNYLKSEVVKSLIEIMQVMPSIAGEVFTILKGELKELNSYLKPEVAQILIEIVQAKPDTAKEVFIILKEIFSDPDNYFKSEAALSIVEIVRADSRMTKEAFSVLKELIIIHNTDEDFIKCEIASSLAEIVRVMPSEKIIVGLRELLNNPNCYVKYVAIWGLVEIIEINPSIVSEVFIGVKELIINSKIDNYIKCEAVMNLAEIVKAIPPLAESTISVLKELLSNPDYNDDVKYASAISLIEIIEPIFLDKTSYKLVNELLSIIYLTRTKNFYEELDIKAKTTLYKITNHITQEYAKRKNPKMIKWFNECFKELPNIAETRVFLKEICKTILKSGVINQLESQFILNCVKNYHFTFTVAVNKDHKKIAGEIIFEDRRYEIFLNDNLEEFATMLLAATDDPLAEQYKTHKPLFQIRN